VLAALKNPDLSQDSLRTSEDLQLSPTLVTKDVLPQKVEALSKALQDETNKHQNILEEFDNKLNIMDNDLKVLQTELSEWKNIQERTINKFQEEIEVRISNLLLTENLSVQEKLKIETTNIQSSDFTGLNEDVEKWLTYWEQKLNSTGVPPNVWPSMIEQHTAGLPLIWILRNKQRVNGWAVLRQEFMHMFKQSHNWYTELHSYREKTFQPIDMIRIICILYTVFGERKVLKMFEYYITENGYPRTNVRIGPIPRFDPGINPVSAIKKAFTQLVDDENYNTMKFLGYAILFDIGGIILLEPKHMKIVLKNCFQNNWA
jgi:hypothetical protein